MEQSVLNVSLKEYKKSIEDLRASLLGLDQSSSEYAKISQEIKDKQDKLNEVMKVGKTNADAAKGSYNALTQEMSALKTAWKATADEVERAQLGEKILAINNQLKDLDGGIGNYQRNVGNYANAFSEAFSTMGVDVGKLGPAFNLATQGSSGLKKAWDLLKAHPFITIASVLIGIMMKLKSAINGNEESSKKWKVAMSAFQPIINAVTNAIDWLAGKLVDVMLWVSKNLPSAVQFVGKAMKTIGKFIGGVVDVVLWLPKQIFPVFRKIQEGIVGFIGGAVKAGAKILSALGFDETAQKLNSFVDAMETGISKVNDFIQSGMSNAGSYVEKFFNGVGNSISMGLTSLGNSMNTAMKMQEKSNQLDEDLKTRDEERTKSELKQSELRDKIATSEGETKLKYQKELAAEIERNGKAEVETAKTNYEIAKWYADQAPNSKEDNDYLDSLKNKVTEAEATYKNSLASVHKAEQKTVNSIKKEQEAASKAAKTAAEKAERERERAEAKAEREREKAEREAEKKRKEEEAKRLKETKEFVDEHNAIVASIQTNASGSLSQLSTLKGLMEKQGKFTIEEAKKYEEQRHKIVIDSIDKQLEEYDTMLKNTNLAESTIRDIKNKMDKLRFDKMVENAQNEINIEQNKQNEIKKIYTDAETATQKELNKTNMDLTKVYSERADKINQAYADGNITAQEYQKQMKDLNEEYEREVKEAQDTANNEKLDAMYQYWQTLKEKYGEESTLVLDAERAYETEKTNILKKGVEERTKEMQKEADETIKQNEKKKKNISDFTKQTASLLGTVASGWKDYVQAQVDSGKITEEEGEEQFKFAKALQYAQTVINTAQGVQAAITSAQSLGPWGWALGAAQAATVLASGLAQMQTIKNTTLSSSSSSSSSSGSGITVSAGATPLIDEDLDSRSLDALNTKANTDNSNSDNRVYIVEEDIQNSNNRVEVRENNSTF